MTAHHWADNVNIAVGTAGGYGLTPGSSAGVGGALGQGPALSAYTGTLFGQQTPGADLSFVFIYLFIYLLFNRTQDTSYSTK